MKNRLVFIRHLALLVWWNADLRGTYSINSAYFPLCSPGYWIFYTFFNRVDAKRFKQLVSKLHSFISCRLFPPKLQDLPPMSKCTWWIPSTTKVLALLSKYETTKNIRLIRDYWCLQTQSFCVKSFFHVCKHPSPCDITTSWHHVNINCSVMWFTVLELSISENWPCRSHRCPTDTNHPR